MITTEILVGTPDRRPQGCPFAGRAVVGAVGEQALKRTCSDCGGGFEVSSGGELLGFTAESDAAACDEFTRAQRLIARGQE